jgi:chromosome segregation ATPase
MKRLSLLSLTLLFSTTAFAQTNSNDSDTLKSLLSEVRLLRHDLQTTTVAAQRAQILVYRAQAQESVVRRMQERVDDTRSRLAQIQTEQRNRASTLKQIEEKRSRSETTTAAAEQKELEGMLAQIKERFDADANKEQETQARLIESEEQLRLEQAKLGGLLDQLDRLEKLFESSGNPK